MGNRKRKSKKPVVIRFKPDDKVRVKHGITDTDYPDMPMGGWAGTVSKIHDGGIYTVRWGPQTLAAISIPFSKIGASGTESILDELDWHQQ